MDTEKEQHMYTTEQRAKALNLYPQCQSIGAVIQQLEIDVLKETSNLLKKDPGANMEKLRNWEKTVIVATLKHTYSLPLLLKNLHLAKSSYYYCKLTISRDKYTAIRTRSLQLWNQTMLWLLQHVCIATPRRNMHF
jgi:hypothetical protein